MEQGYKFARMGLRMQGGLGKFLDHGQRRDMVNTNRRDFIRIGAKTLGLTLAFEVAGAGILLTPRQAHARDLPLKHLSNETRALIEKLAEALVPGSVKGGVTHFIDHQLGVSPDDCLLIAKYFQVPPPYSDFYHRGLEQVKAISQSKFKKPLALLDGEKLDALLASLIPPPAMHIPLDSVSLFYLCLRSDAVDIVYGSPDGFANLNIPYMEHILPPENWNA